MLKRTFVNLLLVFAVLLTLVSVASAAPPAQEELTYTVKLGDTLWALAEKYLGDGPAYHSIIAATNAKSGEGFANIVDAGLIQPGWKLLIPGGEGAKEVGTEADISAIKEVMSQYAVGCNTGDFDLWISLWADDATRMAPNAPPQIGKDQIREAVKPAFDAFDLDMTIHIEEAKVYGDLGLTRASYTFKITPKAGGDEIIAEPDGKALTLYERQSDGSWKIVYDCFNTNVPPQQE